jgi:hypothetical protein
MKKKDRKNRVQDSGFREKPQAHSLNPAPLTRLNPSRLAGLNPESALKVSERRGNVYENKGPLWKKWELSWYVIENTGTYQFNQEYI